MNKDEVQEVIEQVSALVHENWIESKRAAGVVSRKLDTTGEELMVPYAELSDAAKELDRGTVRTTISALLVLGYSVEKRS